MIDALAAMQIHSGETSIIELAIIIGILTLGWRYSQ